MSTLRVRGGRSADGEPLEVSIADGRVVPEAVQGPVLDATGLTVLPGLLDLQVNGAAGHDITSSPETLWEVGAELPAYGVTAFLPTVVSSAPEVRERARLAWAAGPPPGWRGAVPLGLHYEGPMLAPSRCGAHDPALLETPRADLVDGWSAERGVRIVTLAPELPGAVDVTERLVAAGVVVALGHSAATAEQARRAVAAGAACVTHLLNAMEPVTAREPGLAGLALDDEALVAGVIADGHHLAPETLRLAWRALGPRRFLAVSDTTAALGLPDGPARLGHRDVLVADGTVRLPDGTLAGSATSLAGCLAELVRTTGCSLADAVVTATDVPARLLADPHRGHLRPGARGDLILVDATAGLDVVATILAGEVLHDRRS